MEEDRRVITVMRLLMGQVICLEARALFYRRGAGGVTDLTVIEL